MKIKTVINGLLLLTFSIFISAQLVDDDIRTIHDRIMTQAIWPAKENLSSIAADAVSYTHALNDSCYWPDINYRDKNISNWSPFAHMLRVTVMLQALTAPGSPVQNHTKLSNASRCALNVWLVNDWEDPNWWFNQIGVPLFATSQLLMLGDNATELNLKEKK